MAPPALCCRRHPPVGVVSRDIVKASADWFVTSLDVLREALPRYRVAMIGSGGWVGVDGRVDGWVVGRQTHLQGRWRWEGTVISVRPTRACSPPPPSLHYVAGAWACTAAKLIAENLCSPERGDKYVRELRLYVYEEEVDGR